MKTLLKTAMLGIASLSLVSCGGEPSSAGAPAVSASSSGKSTSRQQAVASGYHSVVQKIYVGYFGRPADAGGLAFFSERFLVLNAPTAIEAMGTAYSANAEVRALIDVFGTSDESKALYPGDNGTFMEAVYRNLFGRPADAAGKAFWVRALDAGDVTRANAAVNIMAGAQNSDIDVINKKMTVASYFTNALVTPTQRAAYSGLEANVGIRAMLSTVTNTTDTTAFQPTVDAAIAKLVANLSPQGMYLGNLEGGLQFASLILENGQYWGLYSQNKEGRFLTGGMVQGNGSANGGSFSAPDVRDFNPSPYNPGSLDATYVPQSKLDGNVGTPNGPIPFFSTGVRASVYDYNVAANPGDISGKWTMLGSDSATYAMTGPVNGAVSAVGDCSFSGTLAPRASGKNVFNASLNFGAGACRLAGQSASGIGFSWLQDGGIIRQLIIATVRADRTLGTVLTGSRVMPSGMTNMLVSTDTVVGTGATATAGKTVTVHYTGYLYNANAANLRSSKFDSSLDRNEPFAFALGAGQVIKGWDQGVAGMRVGGKRTLIIPAALGYGSSGQGSILPDAAMVFDIEMLGVR